MLGKENVLMYAKKRPIVVGNGKNTKKELLMEFNGHYFQSILTEKCWDEILPEGELLTYSWKYNLSNGAIPIDIVDSQKREKLLNIAKKITNAFDLGFCSIDIIETEENEFLIMEINSGVMMTNYINLVQNGKEIAKNIYRKAILAMFEK